MQADAAIGIGTRKSVFQVSFDGASDPGKLRSDLMMPSCFKIDLEQAVSIGKP